LPRLIKATADAANPNPSALRLSIMATSQKAPVRDRTLAPPARRAASNFDRPCKNFNQERNLVTPRCAAKSKANGAARLWRGEANDRTRSGHRGVSGCSKSLTMRQREPRRDIRG
jgi:hypothetical protein